MNNIRLDTGFHLLQRKGNQEEQTTNGLFQGKLNGISKAGQKETDSSSSIYIGKTGLENDPIAERKALAQKRARKAVMDVYEGSAKTDDSIRESKSRSESYKELAKQAQTELAQTREARAHLKEISSPEEYEKISAEYDEMEAIWMRRIESYQGGVKAENQAVEGIKLELLKSHPMVDASKAAESIIQAASKEAVGMFYDQVKENLDELQKENEEKVKELKEKKEEEEQRTEDSKDDKSLVPEHAEEIQKAAQTQDTVRQQIKKVLEEELVLGEDLKGLEVDESL